MSKRKAAHACTLALALALHACSARPAPAPAPVRRASATPSIQRAFEAMHHEETGEAAAQLRAVVDDRPDTMDAGLALDTLADIEGRRLFPDREDECGAEARKAFGAADDAVAAARGADALALYEKALRACPNATYWVHYGNALFALGEYDRARDAFRHGLQRDPWHRTGHRFLSEVDYRTGQLDAGRREAILAVVSDPTYELGWSWLRQNTLRDGGSFHRVRADKPSASHKAGAKIDLNLGEHFSSESTIGSEKEIWLAYGLLVVYDLRQTEEGKTPKGISALERERARVRQTLDTYGVLVGKEPASVSPFWALMLQADGAGFLDEAIFLHLIDANLVEEYRAYRDQNGARLVQYVDRVVAPIETPPDAPHV